METHPEEFYQDRKSGVKFNWSHQIKDNKKFMTEDEYKAVWSKYSEINLERSMQDVTERLLAPEPTSEIMEQGYGQPLTDAMVYMQQQKVQMEHQRELMKIELEARRFIKGEI
jgi:flagellar hook-basal body complex protein FliE